jgi:ribosomal protein L33
MASGRDKIRMVSTGLKKDGKRTGYFKTTTKNKRNMTGKFKKKYFDPRAWNEKADRFGMHVEFVEDKIK